VSSSVSNKMHSYNMWSINTYGMNEQINKYTVICVLRFNQPWIKNAILLLTCTIYMYYNGCKSTKHIQTFYLVIIL
jgi:hypothetical protein